MGTKLDPDIKQMSFSERGQALQQLRNLVAKTLNATDNGACWINEVILAQAIGLQPGTISLPRERFLSNCNGYFRKKQIFGLVTIGEAKKAPPD